ncbi:hypothetical protein [Microbacterium saperdae]|uniref:Uncharacterized protein n=1 Tax=Microbacterium saperdae TaxID=69368 RepID=A0A543BQY6_9MICO|nr:hypothetical protein [Microbacterium saperdae]TQL87227.1 hypothetical protein FB560_2894 [Microbacterium saperdae]GGM41951.1 hypothetical protein GCM10010489_11230 [Microbacterium saperdae]
MDPAAALALNVVLAVTSVVGAGVAVWQALSARHSREEAEAALESAERAAAASERQAAAAERSVQLQEEASQPDPWSAKYVVGDTYACVSNARRPMIVTQMRAEPPGSSIYWSHVAEGHRYEPGDRLQFMYSTKDPDAPHKIVLEWRYEDEERIRTYTLAL